MGGIHFNGPTTVTSSVFAGDGAVIHMGAAGPAVAAPPVNAHPLVAAGQRWDLFLSHASPDKATWARPLHALLHDVACFFDEACVPDGADWDTTLLHALRTAPVIAVLVSQHAEAAHYLRDEVRAVIERARHDGGRTRVIPVALGGWPAHLPFGLGLKQGFVVSAPEHLPAAAERLRRVVQQAVRQDRLTLLLELVLPRLVDLQALLRSLPRADPFAPAPGSHAEVVGSPALFDLLEARFPEHAEKTAFVRGLWT